MQRETTLCDKNAERSRMTRHVKSMGYASQVSGLYALGYTLISLS